MPAILVSIVFLFLIVLSILIMCGLPLGEFTMGGAYKVFPKKMRIVLIIQVVLQLFFAIIIFQQENMIPLWFSKKTTRIICIVIATYLSLNTLMNLSSKSKKEKCVMTPLSAFAAICFWIAALF